MGALGIVRLLYINSFMLYYLQQKMIFFLMDSESCMHCGCLKRACGRCDVILKGLATKLHQ